MPHWAYLKESLRYLYLFLDGLIEPIPVPACPVIVSHREVYNRMSTGFTKQMGYTIAHHELATPNDVAKVRLYVSLDGTEAAPVELAVGDTHEVVCNVGQAVEVAFTAVDDAGNESPRSQSLSFTAADDIPPDAPGAPTVVSHRQVMDGGTPPPGPTDTTTNPPAQDTTTPPPAQDTTTPPPDNAVPPADVTTTTPP